MLLAATIKAGSFHIFFTTCITWSEDPQRFFGRISRCDRDAGFHAVDYFALS